MLTLVLIGPAACQEQDNVGQIVDRIVAGEQEFLAQMRTLQPFLETYIQEFGEADENGTALTRDHYMLSRLDFAKGVSQNGIALSAGFHKKSHSKNSVTFLPTGWAQMVVPDAYEFNRASYDFEYSRREFLGDVRTLVFEVSPRNKKAAGKFMGSIWVDDQDFRIVRFNGTYPGASLPGCSFTSIPGA